MTTRGLARGRWSYRRGPSSVLFALAMLVVIACATGPFYERAVEQATTRSTLAAADRVSRGLVLAVAPGTSAASVAPSGPDARWFGTAVGGTDVAASFEAASYHLTTSISYRDADCSHLVFASGRCAAADGEVTTSTSSATALHLTVGQRLTVSVPRSGDPNAITENLLIVGLYRPFSADDDYWFGTRYSSTSGIVTSSDGVLSDAFFGTQSYLAAVAGRITAARSGTPPRAYVDVPLRPDQVGVNDIGGLRAVVTALSAPPSDPNSPESTPQLTTALPNYLDEVDAGRRDAARIVLAITAQLALVAVIAFGVVVAAAADQRRPELALARLRGHSLVRTALVFSREIGVLVVAAVVPGLAVAWGLTALACRVWLVPGVVAEWRWPVLLATAAALVLTLAIVLVTGLRVSRQPITDLLRQVPARVSRAGVGAVEVAVGVAAAAGLVASLGGDRRGALAVLTPTFLAVVIGLIVSRLLVLAARRTGRRSLWQGSIVRSLAALGIARRPGARFTVTVLCVATALVVFAGQQWAVASANRSERAAAETGAAVVLDVSAPSARTLTAAVRAADPSGQYATPVVVVQPPGISAVPVVAVDPGSFGAIASWGRSGLAPSAVALAELAPAPAAPTVAFTGSSLAVTLATESYRVLGAASGTPVIGAPAPSVSLQLNFTHNDGRADSVVLGPLSVASPGPTTLTGAVDCGDGCRLTGIAVARPVLDSVPVDVSFTVSALSSGGGGLAVGSAGDWASVTPHSDLITASGTTSMTVTAAATGLTFHAVDNGDGAAAQYLDVPVALPALLAGPKPDTTDALGYVTAATLSGSTGRIAVHGTVPFVPQIGGSALLVDLALAGASATGLDATAHPSVWLGSDDPAREARLRASLQRSGVTVTGRHSAAELRGQYAHSAPGWSAQLTLVVAAIADLLAVALLVLVVTTSRRIREQDLSAMRLVGVSRRRLVRATLAELAVVVLVGVLGGAVAGVIGVRLTLPGIPVFTVPAAVPLPVAFPIQWLWLVGGVVVGLVLLGSATAVLARRIVGRATPARFAGDGS